MVNCRFSSCGMIFKSINLRDKHEDIFHKDLFKSSANKIFTTVLATNSELNLNKKCINVNNGFFSYREIEKLGFESEEYKLLEEIFVNTIKSYLNQNSNRTIEDYFRSNGFIINGQ